MARPIGGIAAVVVAYEAGPGLRACVEALLAGGGVDEVCVVDNGSIDGSMVGLAALDPRVQVLAEGGNDGFGGGANRGVAATTAPLVAILNPDVTVPAGALSRLAETATADGGAVVGPLLDTASAGARWAGWEVDITGMPWQARPGHHPVFVQGACMVLTRADFERIGGFDARYFLFAEDLELCWRALRLGLDVRTRSDVAVAHTGGGSLAGGYARDGDGFTTSEVRLVLGARNQLAAICTCAPLPILGPMALAAVAKTLAMATVLVASGRAPIAARLLEGIAWNIVHLRASVARRRSASTTAEGRRAAMRRITLAPQVVRFLCRHGRPGLV